MMTSAKSRNVCRPRPIILWQPERQGIAGVRVVGMKRLQARRHLFEKLAADLRAVRTPPACSNRHSRRVRTFNKMFRVRSSFKGKIQVQAPLQAVRNFFSNLANFTDMLGGVENIRHETGGIALDHRN